MVDRVVLELPEALQRRIENIAAICETSPAEVIHLALDAACTPDPHKLQMLYALCARVDRAGPAPPDADTALPLQ